MSRSATARTGILVGILITFLMISPSSLMTEYVITIDSVLTSPLSDESIQLHALTRDSELRQTPALPPPEIGDTIAIIVQNSLYSSVASAVTQYRQDLNDTGYRTILHTDEISTVQDLKDLLLAWYSSENLDGAVLIGRLPYAQYYHPSSSNFNAETFICDLYLEDLDGTWVDISPADGILDGHSANPNADIYPEIFIGRIDPNCLSWGAGDADHINTYLSRVHTYRTGGVQRSRRALVYIDDDWSGYWGDVWNSDIGLAYPTRTYVSIPTTWTNATDWLDNRLIQDYQWAHLCAHSSATYHAFGPSGSEGYATSDQILSVPPAFNFYNLFCCSGAKWTISDNLAVTYMFSGPNSLAVIGSSKTGSMMDCDEFYGPLNQNLSIGSSMELWFSNSLTTSSTAGNEYLEWYYGMNIVGDPLLTTYYDCTALPPIISSTSHPDPTEWYSNTRPQFIWPEPADVNGIIGYYIIIDQTPSTIPTPATGVYTDTESLQVSEDLSDGTWYIHIVSVDSVGNIGDQASHFQVNIDSTAPLTEITHPESNYNASTGSINLIWTASDFGSGYNHTIVWIDSSSNIVHDGVELSTTISNLGEGVHTIHIAVFDVAGNSASNEISVLVDLSNPTVDITSPEAGNVGSSVTVSWQASDTLSGYHHAEIRIDDILAATAYGSNTSVSFDELEQGDHTINVTVFDWVGRSTSAQVQITVVQLEIPVVLIAAAAGIVLVLVIIVIVQKRS